MDFSGQVALVTGGSRGIGRATSEKLGRLGAAVVVNYVGDARAASETVDAIKASGGQGLAVQADVSDPRQARDLSERVTQEFGALDILVNNAGINRDGLVLRMSPEDWSDVLNINLGGAFNCTQAAAKSMIKRRKGAIVNVSSVVGLTGNAGQANYAASKAGLIGLTKSVAKELAGRNVRVNAVAPGFIVTDMTQSLTDKLQSAIVERIPMGRFGSPEEVADTIAWLASDDAKYITGQVIVVDGGLAM